MGRQLDRDAFFAVDVSCDIVPFSGSSLFCGLAIMRFLLSDAYSDVCQVLMPFTRCMDTSAEKRNGGTESSHFLPRFVAERETFGKKILDKFDSGRGWNGVCTSTRGRSCVSSMLIMSYWQLIVAYLALGLCGSSAMQEMFRSSHVTWRPRRACMNSWPSGAAPPSLGCLL